MLPSPRVFSKLLRVEACGVRSATDFIRAPRSAIFAAGWAGILGHSMIIGAAPFRGIAPSLRTAKRHVMSPRVRVVGMPRSTPRFFAFSRSASKSLELRIHECGRGSGKVASSSPNQRLCDGLGADGLMVITSKNVSIPSDITRLWVPISGCSPPTGTVNPVRAATYAAPCSRVAQPIAM